MPKPSKGLPQPETKWITIEDFEYLCFNLTREILTFQEPIPSYSTRDNHLLESAIGQPQQTFDNKFLYPTLSSQASALFYSLIKNHPFRNGNKRIAVMSLLVFLKLNRKWLKIKPIALYLLACDVAKSKSTERKKVLSQLEKEIRNSMINDNQ